MTPISDAPIGMEYTNRQNLSDLMSKNNFTTEAPLIFASYIHRSLGRGLTLIKAVSKNGALETKQEETGLPSILNVNPDDAYYSFETTYNGYRGLSINEPRKSDVVVIDRNSGNHASAFEVKLCVIPNAGTAAKDHDQQSLEIVLRPPTIEQLAFSIADTYGEQRRQELGRLITGQLGDNVQGYQWTDKRFMLDHLDRIHGAVKAIATEGIDKQKPFILMGIWRTTGQSDFLEERCFDTFAWTNLAFLQLLSSRPPSNDISRPDRSLIWLIKALFDYSAQGRIDFKQSSDITFGLQTDKAGAFAGNIMYKFMNGERFKQPLISRDKIPVILPSLAQQELKPERRLDAALKTSLLTDEQYCRTQETDE